MCNTQELHLDGNKIGDVGITALASACADGALASLQLFVMGNGASHAGLAAASSPSPRLQHEQDVSQVPEEEVSCH